MKIINITELSKKYHVARRDIKKGIDEGRISYYKTGRIYDIEEKDFLPWLEEHHDNHYKVKWNREIFNVIDKPEKAYWLGFLMADGCMKKQGYVLTLDIGGKDIEHMKSFIHFLEGDVDSMLQKTYHSITGNLLVHVQITGQDFYNNLLKLGLFPNKSGKEVFIKTGFDKDFIRGIIDGDGYIRKDLTEIGLVGSYQLLVDVQEYFLTHLDVKPNKIMEHGTIFKISYRSSASVYKIVEHLYKDASVSLQRKQELAEQIFTKKIC